jgi:hypothetical protein
MMEGEVVMNPELFQSYNSRKPSLLGSVWVGNEVREKLLDDGLKWDDFVNWCLTSHDQSK